MNGEERLSNIVTEMDDDIDWGLSQLKEVIASGVDVNKTGKQGLSPLMQFAAYWEDCSALIQELRSAGADLEQRYRGESRHNWGDTALAFACGAGESCGHGINLKTLIALGAKIDTLNDLGIAPVEHAVRNASAEHLRLLLEAGADPNSLCKGESLLAIAMTEGNINKAVVLVQHGAEVNELRDQQILGDERESKGGETSYLRQLLDDPKVARDPHWQQQAATAINTQWVLQQLEHGGSQQLLDVLFMEESFYATLNAPSVIEALKESCDEHPEFTALCLEKIQLLQHIHG